MDHMPSELDVKPCSLTHRQILIWGCFWPKCTISGEEGAVI